ncbi:MAG: succinate dehydrogenase/fumarate reductase iron-sulfur subunit [Bellilinea sp.]
MTFQVFRYKEGEAPHHDAFTLEVNPDEYVLDAVERVWAFHDRSLCFRHACHHSTCGVCGMRVNHVEKLTCITPIRSVTRDGGTVVVEPLRNFPIISDLVVDMGSFYLNMDRVGAPGVLLVAKAEVKIPASHWNAANEALIRLSDCIECGLCISACPTSATSAEYLGPAVLAGAHVHGLNGKDRGRILETADSEDGLWRCHSAFECTAVCPSFVDPARHIMALRNQVIAKKVKTFFGCE